MPTISKFGSIATALTLLTLLAAGSMAQTRQPAAEPCGLCADLNMDAAKPAEDIHTIRKPAKVFRSGKPIED